MRLYLVRHGIAANADGAAMSDAERPLTARGVEKTRAAARGMRALHVNPTLILSSPLIRARQTAEIVAAELSLPADRLRESRSLTPGADALAITRELLETAAAEVERVMLVGHQPHLAGLASLLLCGVDDGAALVLRKASLCEIDAPRDALVGGGVLRSLTQPKQLRALG